MGNGYKGFAPELIGKQKLYLEVTGLQTGSEAYSNLCDWFVREKTTWSAWHGEAGPRGRTQCVEMQQMMLNRIFPDMMSTTEMVMYLREVFADKKADKAVLAELVIQRFGLDAENGMSRKMTYLAPEFARQHGYAESTVKAMLSKALNVLRRDTYFREALKVPELSDNLFNYWQFVFRLLMDDTELEEYAGWREQMFWTEEKAQDLAEKLQAIGVSDLMVLDQAVENWLSTLPEEARLAAKIRYGLGYPLIGRSDDYIAAASGFGDGRNLLDFLTLKLNRASLCTILGKEIAEVDYDHWYYAMRWPKNWQSAASQVDTLGLSPKAVDALFEAGIDTVDKLLAIDMLAEEEQPWSKQVPSKILARNCAGVV